MISLIISCSDNKPLTPERLESGVPFMDTSSKIFEIDTMHSRFVLSIASRTGKWHDMMLPIKSGRVATDADQPVATSLLAHLEFLKKDPRAEIRAFTAGDFMSVDKSPVISFDQTDINPYINLSEVNQQLPQEAIQNPSHYISGNICLRDSTRPHVFPIRFDLKGDSFLMEGITIIDRTLWNLRPGSDTLPNAKISFTPEMKLVLKLKGKRKA